jgi:hypothetical protein
MNIYGGGQILNTFDRVKYRPMEEKDIMPLFVKLKFNTDFSLPDKLIQDFINDGSIAPTFKKCVHFNNNDFNHIVIHLKKRKNIKKLPPKPSTKKNKKNKKKEKKEKVKQTKSKRIKRY